MKKCPYCAEQIQVEALICRYCMNAVGNNPNPVTLAREQVPQKRTTHPATWVVAAVLAAVFIGALASEFQTSDVSNDDVITYLGGSSSPTTTRARVTLANYHRLSEGMTYEAVIAILGPGIEQSRSDLAGYTTVMYGWEGHGLGANMNAMFQNGRLVTKAQFGLK